VTGIIAITVDYWRKIAQTAPLQIAVELFCLLAVIEPPLA
jgi:hypothetical protein